VNFYKYINCRRMKHDKESHDGSKTFSPWTFDTRNSPFGGNKKTNLS